MAIYIVEGRFEIEVETNSEKEALRKADNELGMVDTSNMIAYTFDDEED